MLTREVIDLFDKAVLCWLSTVDGDGSPSVSPKETFVVRSADELLIADIASPRSVRNIRRHAQVCVAAVDVFEQHGYQVYGTATVSEPGSADFEELARPLRAHAGPRFPVRSVISVRVQRVSRILAPSLWMYPDESATDRRAGVLDTYGVREQSTLLEEELAIYVQAARWVDSVVGAIPDGAWDGPGLGGWDLRALVGHTSRALLTVEQYLSTPADTEDLRSAEEYYDQVRTVAGGDPSTVLHRGIDAGRALGDHPAAGFSVILERVTGILVATDDVLLRSIAGGIRLSNYLPTRTFELVVHGLDIVRATGVDSAPPAPTLRRALDLAGNLAERSGAGADVLLALTGRQHLRPGFSVLS